MSLKSWLEEFYPIPANEVSADDALDHSIKKWEGLQKANLDRHQVNFVREDDSYCPAIEDESGDGTFFPRAHNCALCEHFQDYVQGNECEGCPLYHSRGVTCSEAAKGEDGSPWHQWTFELNPHPMLVALRRAKQWVEEQREGEK